MSRSEQDSGTGWNGCAGMRPGRLWRWTACGPSRLYGTLGRTHNSQEPFKQQPETAYRYQRHKYVPLEQLRYDERREQYDPRDRLSQFGASDLDDYRQNQPHGCHG